MRPILQTAVQCADGPVFLVGGALRDLLCGRETIDIDLAYAGQVRRFAEDLSRKLGGRLVELDETTRVYRIVLNGKKTPGPIKQVDVAQLQGRDIHEDIARRDFSINALAVPLTSATLNAPVQSGLIDPRGGMKDLTRRIIRADRPEAFAEDPLRLLRAFRLAAQLNFTIDRSTIESIRKYRDHVVHSSGERIRTELMMLLSNPQSSGWMRRMDEAGLLTSIFEDLEDSRRCAQVYYGEGGVLRHTLDALERMDFLLENLKAVMGAMYGKIENHFKEAPDWKPLLRLGVILHDIAKPATAKKIGGRLRFFGHDEIGADMAADVMRRYRFSRQEIESVSAYVRYHLRPGNLAANRMITDRAVFRFFYDIGFHGVGLALVCWADYASYLPADRLKKILRFARESPQTFDDSRVRDADALKTLHHLQTVYHLLHSFFNRSQRIVPPKILDGNEVMKILDIPPGPKVGKILLKLQEAQAGGKVSDRLTAVAYIKKVRVR